MAIASTISLTYGLNTAGGTNTPAPVQVFNSTVLIGTAIGGPSLFPVTTTPSHLPWGLGPTSGGPVTGVYNLWLSHQGLVTDAPITLDMINFAGGHCIISLNPGGFIQLFNGLILNASGSPTNDSAWQNWLISSASATTAGISLVYT